MTRWQFVTLFAVIVVPLSAAADFKRDYGNGLRAAQDGDWERAASDIQHAIADNPQAAERVRIHGMRLEPYLPHYYLGLAKFNLGDCDGAMDAWDASVRQGVIQQLPEFSELQEGRSQCQASSLDVTAIAQAARNAVTDMREALAGARELSSTGLLHEEWRRNESWGKALADAERAANKLPASIDLAETNQDAEELIRAQTQASNLKLELDAVYQSANQRLATVEREQENLRVRARRDLVQAVASARGVSDETGGGESGVRLRGHLASLISRANALAATAPVSDYVTVTRNINNTLREYRLAVQDFENQQRAIAQRTPPDALKRAAEAYFAGQYPQAIQLADPNRMDDDRARIQAHLFRAAARYNQFMLDGNRDANMLRQAENDIRAIKQLDASFSPYLAAFSPKFMNLFQNTL